MLRPIDMTMTIKHSVDANRAGAGDAHASRPEVAAQMFADRLEKQAKMQETTVNQTENSEKKDVNRDRSGNGGGYDPKRKKKKTSAAVTPDKSKPTGESMYDIRI